MTHLCVPIFVTKLDKARREIAAALAAGADLIELRIDKIDDDSLVKTLSGENPGRTILTRRSKLEGGFHEGGSGISAARDFAYIDIELAAVLSDRMVLGRTSPDKVILSTHDLRAKPANLDELVKKANALPAGVNKIVWQAQSILENLDALKLLKNSKRPTIALCMGEVGLISRVLAKKFGAFLTFASLDAESATAPGQITIADLKNLYRWDAIKSTTKVFGVVAHPVRHSMSPAIHNAAFADIGFDGVYLPMLVEPDYDSFKSFMDGFLRFDGMDLSGLSVTIPHKENALRYLKETGSEIEELGERIGAINTISIERSGKLSGKNTDYAAILESITGKLGVGRDGLQGLRVAVLGAGGTGRAAVAGLTHYGANVIIWNRSGERAKALAEEFEASVMSLDELCREECDVFINATSVGMYPKVEENPLGGREMPVSAKTLVFDTIYNPMKTRLLIQAEAAGAKTIGGVEMFVRQAAAQFETWTNQPAPLAIMRRVISDRLDG
jgi:3-dehydroquinate dehydratase/shikimate dehydrogenase